MTSSTIIAIDGLAASGKVTQSRWLALLDKERHVVEAADMAGLVERYDAARRG